MRKKIGLLSIVALLMLVSAGAGAYAATKMTLIVNGRFAGVEPKVINNTTYVPLRAAAELLGATVGFDKATNTVTINSAGNKAAPVNVYLAEDFVFTQLIAKNTDHGWDVTVEASNSGTKDYKGASITASFYDASGTRLGTATGTALDLSKDESKTATMLTKDDLTGWKTVKFQIDFKY